MKIDLHGMTYAKVEEILPDWIITNYNNGYDDFEIITGNSYKMKGLVKKICSENGFIAVDNFNGNSGALTVGIDKIL